MDYAEFIKMFNEAVRERLRIEASMEYGCYGNPDYVQIKLLLDDEEISSTHINLPSQD